MGLIILSSDRMVIDKQLLIIIHQEQFTPWSSDISSNKLKQGKRLEMGLNLTENKSLFVVNI